MIKDVIFSITPIRWYFPVVETWPSSANRPWRALALRLYPLHFYVKLKDK